jgi:hypothetical protein
MTSPSKPATEKFPDGQMHPGDEGALQFGVARDSKGNVHIDFGKDVSWLAMPPQTAIQFARLLLKNAGVKKVTLEL